LQSTEPSISQAEGRRPFVYFPNRQDNQQHDPCDHENERKERVLVHDPNALRSMALG